ncbi:MAG: SUMF1/EgtB/PvdO family nonheme iron enzyme [Treponema sp.]|nr:SUMF1/EgtB/PvdO family nonheme iron enzyme [Treponema sp.]
MKKYYGILLMFLFISCNKNELSNEIFVKGSEFDFSNYLNIESEKNYISDFYISKYMVTREQYEYFVVETSYEEYKSSDMEHSFFTVMPESDSPAMFVSFYDACAYCNWLSLKNNLQQVYKFTQNNEVEINKIADGYRLPTKIEWFYAFLGGIGAKNKWWDKLQLSDYVNNTFGIYSSIGKLQPNSLGLYDMLGNGLEWTETDINRDNLSVQENYKFVIGTGIPGNSIQDYDDLINFLTAIYIDETVAYAEKKYFYIGFRIARNAIN